MTSSYVIVLVIVITSLIIFGLTRLMAGYLIRLEYKNVQFLSGLDILFSNGKSSLEKCVNANMYCKGKVDIERIRNQLLNKMVRVHPRLHSYIEQKYGYKFWMIEENFHIDDHVIWHPHLDVRNQEQLHELVRKFHATPLAYKSSPWHIDIVQLNYSLDDSNGQPVYCMICTFHHAIADGHSMLFAFLNAVRDSNVSLPKMPEPKRTQKSVPLTILSYVKAISMFPLLFMEMLVFRSTTMFEPNVLSGTKLGVTSRNLEVKKLKRIKRIMRTNFTSVLATCTLSALQKYFRKRRIAMPEIFYNVVAFPLRKSNDQQIEMVNNFVIFPIGIPVHENTTPKDRMKISKTAWSSDDNFAWYLFFDLMAKVVMPLIPSAIGEILFGKLIVTLIMVVAGHDANEFKVFDNGSSMFKVDLNANMIPAIGIGINFFTQGEYIDVTLNMDTNLATKEDIQTILNDMHLELLELDKAIK